MASVTCSTQGLAEVCLIHDPAAIKILALASSRAFLDVTHEPYFDTASIFNALLVMPAMSAYPPARGHAELQSSQSHDPSQPLALDL